MEVTVVQVLIVNYILKNSCAITFVKHFVNLLIVHCNINK